MSKEYSTHVQTVLEILKNEVDGDVKAAKEKMTDDYTMTWVYQARDKSLFPSSDPNPEEEMEEIYKIEGRKYEIYHIAEAEDLVMLELVESYPDPETGKVYRTPEIIVLEFEGDKIRTGRHFTDPRLSFEYLNDEQIDSIYKVPRKPIIVID